MIKTEHQGFEIKRPKIVGNIEEPNANRVIKIPKVAKVDDKRKNT